MIEDSERTPQISKEFKHLLSVVQKIELDDFEGALEVLSERKDELKEVQQGLLTQLKA